MASVKSLVLPIFRRHWLWYAIRDPASELQLAPSVKHWREGENLEAKFQLLMQQISDKVEHRLIAEWTKLETASEGSFRNRLYRLAQAVLARENPKETFLKEMPSGQGEVQVIFPASFDERLVRRRLRLLVSQSKRHHRRRMILWALAMIPQTPLMLTPLPNITVYYTGYRIFSHYKALQGSKSLDKGFTALDSQQLRALRDQLLLYQTQHGEVEFPADSWPAKLIKREHRYMDIFERFKIIQKQRLLQWQLQQQMSKEEAKATAAESAAKALQVLEAGGPNLGLNIVFTPSEKLEGIVKPEETDQWPITDDAAIAVGKAFDTPKVLEMVARARRRITGSMFPVHR